MDAGVAWFRGEGGYILEQSTRPRSVFTGLGDSPAGLAAWMVEKLGAWEEPQVDEAHLRRALSLS